MLDRELLPLYHGLREGESVATQRLFDACAPRLVSILRKSFRALLSDEELMDAVHDALMALYLRPERFDPARGSLMNYLVHIARNAAVGLLRKKFSAGSKFSLQFVGGAVELDALATNKGLEGSGDPAALSDPETLSPEAEALLNELLPNPRDRQLWELICQGRGDYAEYAVVLGIRHLPADAQKREVKRHRDRVQKYVKRHEAKFRRLLLCDLDQE